MKLETGLGLMREASDRDSLLGELEGACAMDPRTARGGKDYGWLLKELFGGGLLDETGAVKETAGIFFVARKDSRLRLIFDTRRPNSHFVSPDPVEMASSETFAAIEISATNELKVCSGDMEACFYQSSTSYLVGRSRISASLPSRLGGFHMRSAPSSPLPTRTTTTCCSR